MQIVCRNRKRKQRRLNDKMTRRKNVQHIYELLLKTQQAKEDPNKPPILSAICLKQKF